MKSLVVSLAGFLAAAACLSGAGGGGSPRRASAGAWGATGIALEVTDSGGTIEYDCANGSITEPLVLDADGRFDAKGFHVPRHPGPTRDDDESKGMPVRYTGQVQGDTMTLTVRPQGGGTRRFWSSRGETGRIRRCG
jgi:hypothetical protein